jgi:hypothetical protein
MTARIFTLCLLAGVAVTTFGGQALGAAPKPWQWTTAQASAALMRQAEDFAVVDETERDLMEAICRGKGKPVQRRYVAFTCVATLSGSIQEGQATVRVVARTRRAGGLCWAVAPASIPSACLTPGKRAEGSAGAAWSAAYRTINDRYVQKGRCDPHGSGFFTCSWVDAQGEHRGTVTFSPAPIVRVLS